MSEIDSIINEICRIQTFSVGDVFEDILNLYICLNSFGRQEKLYQEIYKKYNKNNPKEFVRLTELMLRISSLYIEPVQAKKDFDILGDIYQELASKRRQSGLGQFFTPLEITRVMSVFLNLNEHKNKIILAHEPSVGSARNCISSFNINQKIIFNAVDLDRVCVKISIVNMHLYQMLGSEVIHGDSLALKNFGGYRISLGYPQIENMFGEKFVLDENLKEEISQLQIILIEEIPSEHIFNNTSIYFKRIRNNVEFLNNIDKISNFFKDFGNLETNPEVKKVPEVKQEMELVTIPEKSIKFEFKKSKKHKNQISIFEVENFLANLK